MIDYIVTKIPRFTFEKFPLADSTLTTSMKSVGEVMAIGRTFKESFQKALCSLETNLSGFEAMKADEENSNTKSVALIAIEHFTWVKRSAEAIVEDVFNLSKIDPWFLGQIKEAIDFEKKIDMFILNDEKLLRQAKTMRLVNAPGCARWTTAWAFPGKKTNARPAARQLRYRRLNTCWPTSLSTCSNALLRADQRRQPLGFQTRCP